MVTPGETEFSEGERFIFVESGCANQHCMSPANTAGLDP